MAENGTGRVRALIVDDEELGRRMLRSLLDPDEEVQVVGEAASATEARRKISEQKPDLVFMDIEMPGGSDRCSEVLESSRPWMSVESRSASLGPTRHPSKVVSSRVSRSLIAFQKVSATVRSVVMAVSSEAESRRIAESTSPRSARRCATHWRSAER